jgi:hypothetical protein
MESAIGQTGPDAIGHRRRVTARSACASRNRDIGTSGAHAVGMKTSAPMNHFKSLVFATAVSLEVLAAVSLLGCGITEESDDSMEDGEDDSFIAAGKEDGGGIVEGTPEAIGVLRAANELTLAKLRSDVKLTATPAKNIDAFRSGADKIPGTGDDKRFATLTELDKVKYVGPVAFARLLAYAQSHDFVPQNNDPFDPASCQGPAITQDQATARLGGHYGYGAKNYAGGYEVLMRTRTCSNTSDDTTCGAWNSPQRAAPRSVLGSYYYGGEVGTASFQDLGSSTTRQVGLLLQGFLVPDPTWHGNGYWDGEITCEDATNPRSCRWTSCLSNTPRSTCGYGDNGGLGLRMGSYNTSTVEFAGVVTNTCARLTARPSFSLWNTQVEAAVLVRFEQH